MRLRLLAGLCAATLVTGFTGQALVAPAHAASSSTIRVGSFNLASVSFDGKAGGNMRIWRSRRPVVVSQILSRGLDVVGLQEANQSSVYHTALDYGVNQFSDLRGALNRRGGSYAVTNSNPYNCAQATSSTHCRYRYRGASQDTRIIYNTRTLSLVTQGSVRFQHQVPGKNSRYLAWAVFRARATGKTFFFADTHLDPYRDSVRAAEWGEVIDNVSRLKNGRPVVVVGDFNSSKFDSWSRGYLPAMKRRGFGDVLNQSWRQPVVRARRAEKVTHGWLNSFNGWRRDVRSYAYEDDKHKIGNSIDWIFATNRLRVLQYEVVAAVDAGNQIRGTFPSDHNLVRASLVL